MRTHSVGAGEDLKNKSEQTKKKLNFGLIYRKQTIQFVDGFYILLEQYKKTKYKA